MTHLSFYAPHSIELLFDFFDEFDISTREAYTNEKKKLVLDAIEELLKQKILELFNYNTQNGKLELMVNSIEESLKKIDLMWKKNSKFPDFYNMVWFGTQKWYVEKLEILGMTQTTDWKTFVNEEIGDLEKWIKDNKPM